MDDLDLKIVKDAIKVCCKNLSKRTFEFVFSNGQKITISFNRKTILSALGFKGNLKENPDDRSIKINYNNLNQFQRSKMIKTAEAMIAIFDKENFKSINSVVLLSYDDLENRLNLLVSINNGESYGSLLINSFNRQVEGFKLVDDALLSISGKKIAIPISMKCILRISDSKKKVIVNDMLSKKKILNAREASSVISENYDVVFTDDLIQMNYTKEMVDELKKKKKQKKKIVGDKK